MIDWIETAQEGGGDRGRDLATIVAWSLGLPRLVFSPELAPSRAGIEVLKRVQPPHRHLVPDPGWWRANPLDMLWPEMDAAFVMSGGGNRGPSAATRRPVVSGLQAPRNRGILATLPTASGRCWIAGPCFTRSL